MGEGCVETRWSGKPKMWRREAENAWELNCCGWYVEVIELRIRVCLNIWSNTALRQWHEARTRRIMASPPNPAPTTLWERLKEKESDITVVKAARTAQHLAPVTSCWRRSINRRSDRLWILAKLPRRPPISPKRTNELRVSIGVVRGSPTRLTRNWILPSKFLSAYVHCFTTFVIPGLTSII